MIPPAEPGDYSGEFNFSKIFLATLFSFSALEAMLGS